MTAAFEAAQGPIALALGQATTPTPPPGGYTEPWEVSPGVAGFLAFFVLALAIAVIARFMMRSVRRIDHHTGNRPSAPVPEGGIAPAPRGATSGEDAPRGSSAPREPRQTGRTRDTS